MGLGRALLRGAAVGAVVVALGVAGVVLFGSNARRPETGDRVLLVVASRDGQDGSQVAQLIAVVDVSGEELQVRTVDPLSRVALPDTTYDRLRDAYPFGGGVGVAKAYARATGTARLPVVAVSERGLEKIVSGLGRVRIDVPQDVNAFDGKQLYSFSAGKQDLDGPELVSLLASADYFGGDGARTLRERVASTLAASMASVRPDLTGLLTRGLITSSMSREGIEAFAAKARERTGRLSVSPDVR